MHFKMINPTLLLLLFIFPACVHCWGTDGHYIVCQIAQERLSDAALSSVNELLPELANNNLSSLCSWADRVRFRYKWLAPLHYIDTPDNLCSYSSKRDCKDEDGESDFCVSEAIKNYTRQLVTFDKSSKSEFTNNLTEALMFLSHFMGDIHQPLHVGFTSDRVANTIDVHWYRRKSVLHHVWDTDIIETAEKDYYDEDAGEFANAISQNITKGEWSNQVSKWEKCTGNKLPCPDIYASESIKEACAWAYKDVTNGSVLEDDYYFSRLPVLSLQLAKAGVRLAATLNQLFG